MNSSSLLLALHSSSETLGVGVLGLAPHLQLASFPLGRQLSNDLLPCVETLLPAEQWPQLDRLVVATGPGGFTGTRLTVVLARTLAQQLQIPLHGFSSFLLMARRRWAIDPWPEGERFWLHQPLPRRGVVAGAYARDPLALGGIAEVVEPRLFRPGEFLPTSTSAEAEVEVEADVQQLLALGSLATDAEMAGPWQPVLPLYPTSPVES
jgi:tRNA threonylcarbamoyl adenosine modification protein YeaZ